MTKEELAAELNGRERRDDFPRELLQAAKESNLLIIYGSSDDLVCFAGAITDEDDACNGGTIHLSKKGIPKSDCEDENCPYYAAWLKKSIKSGGVRKIDVYWCGWCGDKEMDSLAYGMLDKPTWCYDCESLNGKFATFDIFDSEGNEREYYCRAVVIDLREVWPPLSYEQLVM